jgi:hypothetical protein
VQPMKGVWRAKTFVSSNRLTDWVILNLDRYTREDSLRLVKWHIENKLYLLCNFEIVKEY